MSSRFVYAGSAHCGPCVFSGLSMLSAGAGSLGSNPWVLGLQLSHFTTRACREHSNKNRSDDCKAEGNIPIPFSIWPLYLQRVLKFFERCYKLNRSLEIAVALLKFTALSVLYMLSVFLMCADSLFQTQI